MGPIKVNERWDRYLMETYHHRLGQWLWHERHVYLYNVCTEGVKSAVHEGSDPGWVVANPGIFSLRTSSGGNNIFWDKIRVEKAGAGMSSISFSSEISTFSIVFAHPDMCPHCSSAPQLVSGPWKVHQAKSADQQLIKWMRKKRASQPRKIWSVFPKFCWTFSLNLLWNSRQFNL